MFGGIKFNLQGFLVELLYSYALSTLNVDSNWTYVGRYQLDVNLNEMGLV